MYIDIEFDSINIDSLLPEILADSLPDNYIENYLDLNLLEDFNAFQGMTPQEERESSRGAEIANAFEDDMFGPSRTEPAARPKLSMISARIRANEERKRVIEICTQKLENIEDPVRDLRRSVCINNTYCRLSEEARKEKEARKRRAREECDDTWIGKKARREVEDECLALLDAIPELGDANLGCAQLARQNLPRQDVLLPQGLLAVLDS